jgi:hypothetical protein
MSTNNHAGVYTLSSNSTESFQTFVPHPLPPNPPLKKEGTEPLEQDKRPLCEITPCKN